MIQSYISVVQSYLSVVQSYISVVQSYLSVVQSYISVVHSYISVVQSYISVVQSYISVVQSYISVVQSYISVDTFQGYMKKKAYIATLGMYWYFIKLPCYIITCYTAGIFYMYFIGQCFGGSYMWKATI